MSEKNKLKLIAYYLPQFHAIPENDEMWGEGFTEWNNVRRAKPLFDGHYQPRVPLDENYYNLEDVNVLRKQAELAREYGVYGFCFYHYWFDEKPLLEKPVLGLLDNKDINIPFCLSWANESWTNAWSSADNKVLIEQKYGNKNEWKKHFEFLLPFFLDERYIKEDNCPFLVVYRPYLCPCFSEMMDYFKEEAIKNGFNGIKIASQKFEDPDKNLKLYDYLDYHIEYQPQFNNLHPLSKFDKFKEKINNLIIKLANYDLYYHFKKLTITIYDYDIMWDYILSIKPDSKSVAGAFVDWDNSPRYGERGSCFKGVSPERFEYYLKKQVEHVKNDYSNDYLFIFAWNEWGESGYLEPDMKNGYDYLKAIRNCLF